MHCIEPALFASLQLGGNVACASETAAAAASPAATTSRARTIISATVTGCLRRLSASERERGLVISDVVVVVARARTSEERAG